MDEIKHYFISVGEKNYFYTLRYFYHQKIWTVHENGNRSFEIRTASRHVRNLNHDFDIAVSLAKKYMVDNGISLPLQTIQPNSDMNDRADVSSITSYDEKLSNKILLSGKFINCHVSEADKAYVQWTIINLHNSDAPLEQKRRNTTLINGQICFDYAKEQGWLDEWITEGENLLKTGNNTAIDEINRIITADVFSCGQYIGQSLADFGYTKKKELRSRVKDYLFYMSNQRIKLDEILIKEEHEIIEHDDGLEECIITSDLLKAHNLSPESLLRDKYALTVIMCRHLCYALNIIKPFRLTKYIFKTNAIDYTDMEKIKRSLEHNRSES